MRHLHTESQVLHAFFGLEEADGYVETLLQLARTAGARGRHGRLGDRRAAAVVRREFVYGETYPADASRRGARDSAR